MFPFSETSCTDNLYMFLKDQCIHLVRIAKTRKAVYLPPLMINYFTVSSISKSTIDSYYDQKLCMDVDMNSGPKFIENMKFE